VDDEPAHLGIDKLLKGTESEKLEGSSGNRGMEFI
jgi:hypothetical protein